MHQSPVIRRPSSVALHPSPFIRRAGDLLFTRNVRTLPENMFGAVQKWRHRKNEIFWPPSLPCHHLSLFLVYPLPPMSPGKTVTHHLPVNGWRKINGPFLSSSSTNEITSARPLQTWFWSTAFYRVLIASSVQVTICDPGATIPVDCVPSHEVSYNMSTQIRMEPSENLTSYDVTFVALILSHLVNKTNANTAMMVSEKTSTK